MYRLWGPSELFLFDYQYITKNCGYTPAYCRKDELRLTPMALPQRPESPLRNHTNPPAIDNPHKHSFIHSLNKMRTTQAKNEFNKVISTHKVRLSR